jgi:hypothetical protein
VLLNVSATWLQHYARHAYASCAHLRKTKSRTTWNLKGGVCSVRGIFRDILPPELFLAGTLVAPWFSLRKLQLQCGPYCKALWHRPGTICDSENYIINHYVILQSTLAGAVIADAPYGFTQGSSIALHPLGYNHYVPLPQYVWCLRPQLLRTALRSTYCVPLISIQY